MVVVGGEGGSSTGVSPSQELVISPHAFSPDEIRDGVDEHIDWFMARHANDFQALADR